MYKIIVFFVLIAGVCCAPQTRKRSASTAECSDRSVYENCIQGLFMIGSPEKHFPNSTEQIKGFCGKLKETDKCVKEYTKKCLSPSGKRATSIAVAGVARLAKRMCRSAQKQQDFIDSSKCGNAVLGDLKKCMGSYKMALYGAKKAKINEKLPILCCKFYDFRGCARDSILAVGPEVCPEKSQQFFARIGDAFQSDVFDLICGDYDESSDKCSKVVVPEVKPSANTKSLFAPLKDVIKSIIEDLDQRN